MHLLQEALLTFRAGVRLLYFCDLQRLNDETCHITESRCSPLLFRKPQQEVVIIHRPTCTIILDSQRERFDTELSYSRTADHMSLTNMILIAPVNASKRSESLTVCWDVSTFRWDETMSKLQKLSRSAASSGNRSQLNVFETLWQ